MNRLLFIRLCGLVFRNGKIVFFEVSVLVRNGEIIFVHGSYACKKGKKVFIQLSLVVGIVEKVFVQACRTLRKGKLTLFRLETREAETKKSR